LPFGIALHPQDAKSSSEAAPQKPRKVRISQGVSQALVIKKVQPEYPDEARRQHIAGNVIMRVEISPEGDVTELALISAIRHQIHPT
jgi:outer membrane biosynthesis protein TonB